MLATAQNLGRELDVTGIGRDKIRSAPVHPLPSNNHTTMAGVRAARAVRINDEPIEGDPDQYLRSPMEFFCRDLKN